MKQGTWLYDGLVPSIVCIYRGDIVYGPGDYEDPPEIQDDCHCECYCVEYRCKGNGASADGIVFLTLAAAVAKVESVLGDKLTWQ